MGRNRLDFEEAISGQTVDDEWVMFPGGELEGRPPKTLCHQCRERKARVRFRGVVRADRSIPSRLTNPHVVRVGFSSTSSGKRLRPAGSPTCEHTLCFQCYRAELDRCRAQRLRPSPLVRRATSLVQFPEANGNPVYAELIERRRQAQIAARHALERDEGQYPGPWRPFVMGE